jgi:hypothetical protein
MRVSITDISVVDILRQDFFADCSGCLDGDRMTGKPEVTHLAGKRAIRRNGAEKSKRPKLSA